MDYVGEELDLFQGATNWKSYWSQYVRPYMTGRALEVGAGLGGNIPYLVDKVDTYTALEPDEVMAKKINDSQTVEHKKKLNIVCGTLENLSATDTYDTIVYIDVLEHIDDDQSEFNLAVSHLSSGGYLIMLCPAHQYLFSPFDAAVGHFRRHSKNSFRILAASNVDVTEKQISYLDSIGLHASLANKWFLKASVPTEKQILVWDSMMVPVSRMTDRLSFNMIGKTIIGIWQKR